MRRMYPRLKLFIQDELASSDLVPLTISAESLTAALEAVSSSGAPLVGATVQLQLHGSGFESALTQLHINEEVLEQLRRGENINITINNNVIKLINIFFLQYE